jgi:hypothetical protein
MRVDRLKQLAYMIERYVSYERVRKENKKRLEELYKELNIDEKVEEFEDLFKSFIAINVTGISLQKENFLEPQAGRYLQIIGIKKEDGKTKNINLRYFGKAQKQSTPLIAAVGEFVLRWRVEKGFLHLDGYIDLVERLKHNDQS